MLELVSIAAVTATTYEVGDLHLALLVGGPSRHSFALWLLLCRLGLLSHAASGCDRSLCTRSRTGLARALATIAHDLVERLAKLVWHLRGCLGVR